MSIHALKKAFSVQLIIALVIMAVASLEAWAPAPSNEPAPLGWTNTTETPETAPKGYLNHQAEKTATSKQAAWINTLGGQSQSKLAWMQE